MRATDKAIRGISTRRYRRFTCRRYGHDARTHLAVHRAQTFVWRSCVRCAALLYGRPPDPWEIMSDAIATAYGAMESWVRETTPFLEKLER